MPQHFTSSPKLPLALCEPVVIFLEMAAYLLVEWLHQQPYSIFVHLNTSANLLSPVRIWGSPCPKDLNTVDYIASATFWRLPITLNTKLQI